MLVKQVVHVCVWAVVGLTASAGAHAAPLYRITDLGLVQSTENAVAGLNSNGQAVGIAQVDSMPACVLYDHGASSVLGSLGGSNCFVNGINDSDIVVGSSSPVMGSQDVHAFSYQNGVMLDLGTYPGDSSSVAVGVNNKALIVGTSSNAARSRVYTYRNGIYRYIAMPAGAVSAYAGGINDKGQITGSATYETEHPRAFLFSNGEAIDLGTLNNDAYNSQSEGLAINAKGVVVGWSSGRTFPSHAMMSDGGQMIDLGALPVDDPAATSVATGINDRGQVVGTSVDSFGNHVAFIFQGKKMIDLNSRLEISSQCWQLINAQAINKSGQISGLAWSSIDQQLHVYLATPDH